MDMGFGASFAIGPRHNRPDLHFWYGFDFESGGGVCACAFRKFDCPLLKAGVFPMCFIQFVTAPLSRLGILAAVSSARTATTRLLISLLACCLATPLYGAALYSASLTETGFAELIQNPPPPVSLVFSSLPPNPLGDATVTVTLAGDFDNSQFEYADIGIFDGAFEFAFGRFLNGNPDDDLFDNPTDVGVGGPPGVNVGSAIIPLSMLENLISDEMMTFRLDFSSGVGRFGNAIEFVTITVAYEVVPEPSGFTLAASAVVVGLLGYVRRRRAIRTHNPLPASPVA